MGKKRKISKIQGVKFGVGWYKPEQWKRLLEVSEDRGNLEDTFEEWKVNAESGIRRLKNQGMMPEKVLIDVEEWFAWCKERGKSMNGESRSMYIAWLLRESDIKQEKA
jgi:hypothetical protein